MIIIIKFSIPEELCFMQLLVKKILLTHIVSILHNIELGHSIKVVKG